MDIFDARKKTPLADRMRPRTLDEFIGQEHIVGKGRLLRRAIETDSLQSSIFFGPPGSGKTTLASIVANTTGAAFCKLNAVTAGVKDVREVIAKAEDELKFYGRSTYLLLDECHRWSKAQSDSILPAIEKGTIKFIGSTTENPMVSMTGAIVSRCRLFRFLPLSDGDVRRAVLAALADAERGLGGYPVRLDEDALEHVVRISNGDARCALNAIELAVLTTPLADDAIHIDISIAEESIQQKAINVDDEQFYNMLSAFCKSLRGSDSDAALAWFARLVYAGVDPRIICRRLIAHASEDVGLANPAAMQQAVAAAQALEHIGMPEARLSIAQAIIFICESPKSNSVVMAVDAAFEDARTTKDEPVPAYLRDTSYSGASKLGSGIGYKYPHDYPGHYVEQEYMPPSVRGHRYYVPSDQGTEARIRQRSEARRSGSAPGEEAE
ncbi:MAG: replication-associated recombination protein A [Clostridia bacterium]|nr:replication-associated recombination protein A [Clostridia bacterium]